MYRLRILFIFASDSVIRNFGGDEKKANASKVFCEPVKSLYVFVELQVCGSSYNLNQNP